MPPKYALAALAKPAALAKSAQLNQPAQPNKPAELCTVGGGCGARAYLAEGAPKHACCAQHSENAEGTIASAPSPMQPPECCLTEAAAPTKSTDRLQAQSEARAAATGDLAQCGHAPKRKVVVSILALKCQGGSSDFTLLPWMIPTTLPCVQFSVTAEGPAPPAADLRPLCVDLNLDTPPPKRSLS